VRLAWQTDRPTEAVWRCLRGLLLSACCTASLAAQLQGQVVRVSDGDTLVVRDAQGQQHTIRLAGIDAPEKTQAHGQDAQSHLAQAVLHQAVAVTYDKRDKYGRIVGKVLAQGVDINWTQLQAGWAWHYKSYQGEQSAEDRVRYSEAERLAREAQKGLWQGHTPPEPPWDYRARTKRATRNAGQ
jgi:endonuclease YncB( thermonuclease family)